MFVDYRDGYDAVFLPGKIHGAEHQIYIVYYNSDADNGNGCFEIEVLDCERILELYKYVNGDAEIFFTLLPDWFQGEWYYCDRNSYYFDSFAKCYNNADFITARDGDNVAKLDFITAFALKEIMEQSI